MDNNSFKNKITSAEAIKIIIKNTKPVGVVQKKIKDACCKVLREDIKAKYSYPYFNSSAMDGYCLKFKEYQEGKKYQIQGTINAGKAFKGRIKKDYVLKITTGAMVPSWVDLVIPFENSKEESGKVSFSGKFDKWNNIRKAGEEYSKGEILLKIGKFLRPEDLGLISSQGINHVKVSEDLKAIVCITGNEFLKKNENLKEGKIFDSNSIMISSLLRCFGVNIVRLYNLKDDFEKLKAFFKNLKEVNFYVFSGGISMGEKDFCLKAFQEAGGKILFSKVKQKPGAPLSFGIKDSILFLFLPGNPVSSYVNLFYYGSILIKNFLLSKEDLILKFPVKVSEDILFNKERKEFIRVKIKEKDGELIAYSLKKQGSHMITSLTEADGIWEKEENIKEVKKGEKIYVYLLKGVSYGL